MSGVEHIERLHGAELELGATDAVQRHPSRTVVGPKPISQRTLDFEKRRPRWLREMMAEATGVFFYVYPGMASTASFLVNGHKAAYGSIFHIGWAYGVSVPIAIITCAPTSGGHFNPAITLCFAFWQGFPWPKVPYYIFSQIFGAFIATLLIMGQYHEQISAFVESEKAAGRHGVYDGGPASIFVVFPQQKRNNLGYLFMTEWFADSFMGIVTWAALDPANPFVSALSAPFVIGLAYASIIWGFAVTSISMNLARDLGARMAVAIFFGPAAFTYKSFAWIPTLVNIPATFFATAYYEMLMRDSLVTIGKGSAVHEDGEEGLMKHLNKSRLRIQDGQVFPKSSSSLGFETQDEELPV